MMNNMENRFLVMDVSGNILLIPADKFKSMWDLLTSGEKEEILSKGIQAGFNPIGQAQVNVKKYLKGELKK